VYKLSLILRYLRKQRVTLFPVAGVAIGVTALIVVLAVMRGYDMTWRKELGDSTPDVTVRFLDIHGAQPASREVLDSALAKLEAMPEVSGVSPYLAGDALVSVTLPAVDSSGTIEIPKYFFCWKGVDLAREAGMSKVAGLLKHGGNPLEGCVYGREDSENAFVVPEWLIANAAKKAGYKEDKVPEGGVSFTLTTLSPDMTAQATSGRVADVFRRPGGMRYDEDSERIFMPLDWARAFSRMGPNALSGIKIKLKSYDSGTIADVKKRIAAAMETIAPAGTLEAESWEDQNAFELSMMAIERRVMACILFTFLVIAGFAIAAILIMIVVSKTRDIGVLQAMGSTSRGVAAVFLGYGMAIGAAGSVLGLSAGILIVRYLGPIERGVRAATGFDLPHETLAALPTYMDWSTNALVVLAAMGVSFLAGLFPAIRAARLDPVEAIRHE
jgi:lipoprotein-releasing system permease protein